MTISISGFSKPSPVYSPKPASSGMAFASALAEASSSGKAAPGDRAVISPAAMTLSEASSGSKTNTSTSTVIDEAYIGRIMKLPEKERLAETAKQADAISASQGLPSGKYDFTKMSVGQLSIVRANMIGNLGVPSNQLSAMWSVGLQKADGGTSFGSTIDWNTPRNVVGEMTRDRDRLISTNDFSNAKIYDAAILAMKNASVINSQNEVLFKDKSLYV